MGLARGSAVAFLVLRSLPRRPLQLALLLLALLAPLGSRPGPSAAAEMGSAPSQGTAPTPAWFPRPGQSFWQSRPWVYGWYRVQPGVWSWWGARAPGWGLANLAPAASITELVEASLASGGSVIVVPGGADELDLASLAAVRPMGVRFAYSSAGQGFGPGTADCQAGLLAGQPPQTPLEAQRLNAVCQVTYGNP